MNNLFRDIESVLASGEPVAMASIVRAKGSGPRHKGARCGVRADGAVIDTIGGGLLEAQTQQMGKEALAEGRTRFLEMRLDNKQLAAGGMVCGGTMDILVVPWSGAQLELARQAAEALDGGTPALLVTVWSEGGARWSQGLWRGDGWVGEGVEAPDLEGLLQEAQAGGKTAMRGGPEKGVSVDPVLSQYTPLVILGGGHVGRALAKAAAEVDFAVTVVDDRPEFASAEAHPEARRVLCHPFEGCLEAAGVDAGTFVVVCTRGHLSDTECTEQAMRSDAPYVGVIASKRKRGMILNHLKEQGITDERIAALRMPVGFDIGAETPAEIAVSILAQMIQVKYSAAAPQG